jgi:predicted flap endonuclease-1-like 5' DNA nuclease
MGGLELQTFLYLAGAAIVGAILGWLLRSAAAGRSLQQAETDWQVRYDKSLAQIENFKTQNKALESSIESEREQGLRFKHAAIQSKTELESVREKANALARNVSTLGAERDELSKRLINSGNLLNAMKQQIRDLQTEFHKSRDFYTEQLKSASEQRRLLEGRIDDAKHEQKSLNNLLSAARSEHASVSRLLASSQARLEGLEKLENKVVALEADNAELRHQATLATKEAESLQHDVKELRELKKQNKELAHCLQSMENSRKQYEEDARRYRHQYEEAEKQSDTLRMKLGDIESTFIAMRQAGEQSHGAANDPGENVPSFGLPEPDGEPDDLTEIVGIGKVFEEMLHDLGVFHFRQIAAFGPSDVARINAELKEFRGRIEHDDWIGQAKELHYKKYG